MKAVSFFSGIGGFDLGFERAGINVTHQIESDAACVSVLKNHFPHAAQLGDINNENAPNADVYVGGFPCQDVSIAGVRKGLAGNMSGLWFSYLAAIEKNSPQWVVIENVTGLLTSNRGRDFGVILDSLAECGYMLAWRVLDSQYFGVPQRRRRLFVVGSLGNGRSAEVLFEPESVGGDIPQIERGDSGFDPHDNEAYSLSVNFAGGVCLSPVSSTLTTRTGASNKQWVIDKGGKVRKLTPLECERLQGFPDNWTVGQSNAQRYKQLGNAVCVPVAQWIGERLLDCERVPRHQVL